MSFRVNFFPVPYVLSLLLLVTFVSVFNGTVYTYFSSNQEINGAIVVFFVFCTIWVLGSLAYFSRSARLLVRALSSTAPLLSASSSKKGAAADGGGKDGGSASHSSIIAGSPLSLSGTLFDTPVFSSILTKLNRKHRLEVTRREADEVTSIILENATRVLAPSKFISGIFILMGLMGTFIGLLGTIGGVASALNSLAQGGLTSDIAKFIKMLSDPLQGMSTAFSASLFGLTCALFSNFGNHSAWQKVSLFAHKVRNYLLSHTGVFDEDPARVSVRDLLNSLEESFDLLYRGLVSKLESTTEAMTSMTKVVVKTQERQEKMMKVIIKDHEVMENFWNRFLVGNEGITYIVDQATSRLAVLIPDAMRKVFGPALATMLEVMEGNGQLLQRVEKGIADSQGEVIRSNSNISAALARHTDVVGGIGGDLMNVNTDIASILRESNDMMSGFARDMLEGQNIGHEISQDLMAMVRDSFDQTISLLREGVSIAGAIEQSAASTVRIADERLSMLIGLSSDLLASSENSLSQAGSFMDFVRQYNQELSLAPRLDGFASQLQSLMGISENIGQSTSDLVGINAAANDIKSESLNVSSELLNASGVLSDNILSLRSSLENSSTATHQVLAEGNRIAMESRDMAMNAASEVVQSVQQVAQVNMEQASMLNDTIDTVREITLKTSEQTHVLLDSIREANAENSGGILSAASEIYNAISQASERELNSLGALYKIAEENAKSNLDAVSSLSNGIVNLSNSHSAAFKNFADLSLSASNTLIEHADNITQALAGIYEVSGQTVLTNREGFSTLHANTANAMNRLDQLTNHLTESSKFYGGQFGALKDALAKQNVLTNQILSVSSEAKDILTNSDGNITEIGNVSEQIRVATVDSLTQLQKMHDLNSSMSAALANIENISDKILDNEVDHKNLTTTGLPLISSGLEKHERHLAELSGKMEAVRGSNQDLSKDLKSISESVLSVRAALLNDVLKLLTSEFTRLSANTKDVVGERLTKLADYTQSLSDKVSQISDSLDDSTLRKMLENIERLRETATHDTERLDALVKAVTHLTSNVDAAQGVNKEILDLLLDLGGVSYRGRR